MTNTSINDNKESGDSFYLSAPNPHFYELGTLIREYRPMASIADSPRKGVEGIVMSEDELTAVRYLADGTEAASFTSGDDYPYFQGEAKKNRAKQAILGTFPYRQPWGILTGVRPSKVAYHYLTRGENGTPCSLGQTVSILKDHYLLREDKAQLAAQVALAEKAILEDHKGTDLSIYVGIPFCPTRCLYCSFISSDSRAYQRYGDDYILALSKEIKSAVPLLKGRRINSFYMGGGTPTTLSPDQLERVLDTASQVFDFSSLKEITVEAGRPDTITRQKLRVLKKYGVSRISVNPQTMQQKTLDLVGRDHTAEQVTSAVYLAREEGFDTINMDLIMGLPGEGEQEAADTLEKIAALAPENLTVHTLAVKRSSRLNEIGEGKRLLTGDPVREAELIGKMVDMGARCACRMGMKPYYMYRQKNMAGNFENVGYSLPGKEGRYNVEIMEEKQSILAFGAGGVSKIYYPEQDRLERIQNMKGPGEYIERINEMIERKRKGVPRL